jgi:hypothetical protein
VKAQMVVALCLAGPLVFLGLFSGWQQIRGLTELRSRKIVPGDEAAYLRGRYRRRLVVGVLLVLIGGLIAGAFLSGMEARADAMGEKKAADAEGEKKQLTPDEKQFLQWYGGYWIAVASLTLALIGFAVIDGLASRKYWLKLYREMRDEHNTQLRRDLAVYMQQKERGRGGFGGRMGNTEN